MLSIFNSGTSTNRLLKNGGVYAVVSDQMRSSIVSSQRVPEKDQEIFQKSVDTAVTDDAVEQIIQPALIDVVTWFQQPKDTPAPDVILVIKPIKDDLIAALQQNGLPQAELTLFKATLTQQVPDQIKLSSLQQLTGAQGAQTDTQSQSSQQEFEKVITLAKTLYENIGLAQIALSIIFTVALVLYTIFARLTKVSMLQAPSLALAIESFIISIICLGIPYALRNDGAMTYENLPGNLSLQIASHFLIPSFVSLGVCIAVYILAILVWNRYHPNTSIKTAIPRR